MFCMSFEKTAISTGMIQGALGKRIAGAMSSGGRSAGAGVIRSFEAKSANLGSKGLIESSGQRGQALRGMLPKAEKPAGNTLNYATMKMNNPAPVSTPKPPATAKPDVFKQNSDRMLRRNTGYAEVK
jgi:hypothetical protein